MSDYAIFLDGKPAIICGTKEKAEEMVRNYPGGEVHEVEEVNRKWVKRRN